MKPLVYPDNWKAITTRLKGKANWTCQKCHRHENKAKGIQIAVHHIDGNTSNNIESNLIVICRKCHLREHLKMRPR